MRRLPQILVLDDDPVVGKACGLILQGLGDVHCFTCVAQALGFAERSQVDLAIVDVAIGQEPEAGVTVIGTVAERMGPTLPIIAMSGRNNNQLELRCLNTGAYDFVYKPFHPAALRARVLRHLATGAALANAGVLRVRPAEAELPFEFAGALILPETGLIQFPDGSEERLMTKHKLILRLLANSLGTVVTRETFARKVWGSDANIGSRSINVYLSTLTKLYKKHDIDLRQWLNPLYGAGWRVIGPADSHERTARIA